MNRRTRLILLSVVVGVSLLLAGCFLISVDPADLFTVKVGSTVYEYEATLDFGPVNPDGEPSVLAAELLNITDGDITVTDVTVDNALFSAGTEALPFTVLAGEITSVSLTFDPTASGVVTAVLSAVIDGADLPFVLNLSGEGNYPPVADAVVVVSGAGTGEVNGTYYRTEETPQDGCPVYRLTGTDYRIYRADTEIPVWFIDNDFDFSPAHYENSTDLWTAPSGTTSDWWSGAGDDPPPSTVGEIICPSGSENQLLQGDEISPNYLYSDAEGNTEGATLYQWYRSETSEPAGEYLPIDGETLPTHSVVAVPIPTYIKVLVTPVAADGTTTGEPVWFGPSPEVEVGGEALD